MIVSGSGRAFPDRRATLAGFVVATALALTPASAAPIADSAAASHVGQTVTVAGAVSGVHVSGKGTVFINFGPGYPDQDFTAVIFASSTAQFGDVMRYEGKSLAVTGEITMWKGKPEMILRTPSQLRALP